jgi:NADPH:quinone reductase-like Zn-dependent oxidoreductase
MSAASLPRLQKAVVATADKSVKVAEKALPNLGDNDVLLQVKAVTLNPTGMWSCEWRKARKKTC